MSGLPDIDPCQRGTGNHRSLRKYIAEDFYANEASWFNPGFHACSVYRVGRWLRQQPKIVRTLVSPLYSAAAAFVQIAYHIEIPPTAEIGRGLRVKLGVAIHPAARIGDDCILRHRVTIGASTREAMNDAPTIGNRVQVGVGSVLMGRIVIGDDVRIGPNAVVMTNVPAGSTVTVAPPRVLNISARRAVGE